MNMENLLRSRRDEVADRLKQIVKSPGPWDRSKKQSIVQYLREGEELGGAIEDAKESRKLDALVDFARHGRAYCKPDNLKLLGEARDLTESGMGTGAATGGGVLIPVQFEEMVTAAMVYAGPMMDPSVTTIVTTATGAARAYPSDDDAAIEGVQVNEAVQIPMADLGGLAQKILTPYMFNSGIQKMSVELAEDVGFDLAAYLSRKFGVRLGRILNQKLTTGSGSGEPKGIVTAATVAGTAGGSAANDGTGGGNTLGTADFAFLEESVDPLYRLNGSWMMNPVTLQRCRALVNKQGGPVFEGLQNPPDGIPRIFGYPVLLNPFMDALQTNVSSPAVTKTPLLFGDLRAYTVRRVPSMLITLRERYADFAQRAYFMLTRATGDLLDGNGGACKTLQTIY
jgi:HK97 family phage major capsid protein